MDKFVLTSSNSKLHGSAPDIRNLEHASEPASRRRKHENDIVQEIPGKNQDIHESVNWSKFTKDIIDNLNTWKSGLEKGIEEINTNLCKSSEELKQEISDLRKDYSGLQLSINNIEKKHSNEISSLNKSVAFLSEQFDSFNKSVDKLKTENKKISMIEDQLKEIARENRQLKLDMNVNNQKERITNLEFIGIPETDGENLGGTLINIAKRIGMDVNPSDIIQINRVTPRTKVSGRPRVIIAKMKTKLLKDNLLSCARKSRITTRDLELPGEPKPIFVNEHLTPYYKLLLLKCKEVAKVKQYQYVWTKNCIVYVRKNDKSPAIQMREEEDLKRMV